MIRSYVCNGCSRRWPIHFNSIQCQHILGIEIFNDLFNYTRALGSSEQVLCNVNSATFANILSSELKQRFSNARITSLAMCCCTRFLQNADDGMDTD